MHILYIHTCCFSVTNKPLTISQYAQMNHEHLGPLTTAKEIENLKYGCDFI